MNNQRTKDVVELKVLKKPEDDRYLYVKDWDRWQTYRRDRGTPPWFKVYGRELLVNYEFAQLTDAEKGQLFCIWCLACSHDGKIPADPKILQKMTFSELPVSVNKFIDLGFLSTKWQPSGNQLATMRRQNGSLETETETETETDNITTTKVVVCESSQRESSPSPRCPYQKIIDTYHEMLPSLRRVEKLTATRKQYIRSLWCDDLPDLNNWRNFFDYIGQSDFLMGRCQGNGGRKPFVADLEWITKPANFAKICEGKYHA